MAALIVGANGQGALSWAQCEWIQGEIIGRLAVGFDGLSVHNQLDAGDVGLTAGLDRNLLCFSQCGFGQRLKIGGQGGGQRRDLKFSLKRANIPVDIADGNIECITARGSGRGFNDITLIDRNGLAVNGIFDADDVLVGSDLNDDLSAVGQRFDKGVAGQEDQWHWNWRAQDSAVGCALSVWRGDMQREVMASAIGREGDIQGNDVLRAEQIGEIVIDGDQFFGFWQIIENSIRFPGDRFEEALVNVPTQADGINWHAMNGGGVDALVTGIAADISVFMPIGQNDDRFARQGRTAGGLDAVPVGVVQGGLSTGIKLVNDAKQFRLVGCVIDEELKGRVKNGERDRVIGPQRANIISGGLSCLCYRQAGHAVAGVNHQHTGKCQRVIGDIFHLADRGNPRQFTANLKIARFQPGNKLPTGIQYADIDGHSRQVGCINADDVDCDADFVLCPCQAERHQQYQRSQHVPSKSLHVKLSDVCDKKYIISANFNLFLKICHHFRRFIQPQ